MLPLQQRFSTQSMRSFSRFLFASAAVALSALAAPAVADAADSAGVEVEHPKITPKQQQQLQNFMQKRQELGQIQDKLKGIQQKALDAHPQLQHQQDQFIALLMDKMKNEGLSPEKEIQELRAMQTQMQQTQQEAKRESLMQAMQQKAAALEQAQRQAMKNQEVRQAYGSLAKSMLAAMEEINPQTQTLLQQAQKKQAQLASLKKSFESGAQ